VISTVIRGAWALRADLIAKFLGRLARWD